MIICQYLISVLTDVKRKHEEVQSEESPSEYRFCHSLEVLEEHYYEILATLLVCKCLFIELLPFIVVPLDRLKARITRRSSRTSTNSHGLSIRQLLWLGLAAVKCHARSGLQRFLVTASLIMLFRLFQLILTVVSSIGNLLIVSRLESMLITMHLLYLYFLLVFLAFRFEINLGHYVSYCHP